MRSTTDQFIFHRRTPSTEEASTGPSAQPQDDTSAIIVCDSPSSANAETGADTDMTNSRGDTEIMQIGEEQGDDVANVVNLEEKTVEIDEGQAGSDPAGPDPEESRVALARPNPEPMHDEFMANVYPNVHESLKFPADEHVILEDPLSSTGTLSSIKNLDDAFTIGDNIFLTTTVTTPTTLTLPPPPPTQSSTNPELAARVLALEKRNAKLEQAFMNQNKTTNNLASRIFTLEHRDLEYRIDNYVRETVKENVQISLRAPLLQSFRDPSEIEMKEILHQQMFKSGSYKTHSEHADLYEALKRSMARDNMDEFIVEQAKSRKRCRDDQDPPQPPPKESDQNTRDTPSSSSKQQQASQSEQPIDDVPTSDTVHISDSEDVGVAHLPKIKTSATWLRPLPEKDRPDHPEENKLLQKTGDMGSFIKWFCKRIRKKKLGKSDLEGLTFKVVKAFYENSISLQFQMEECHRMLTD
ncbi:hypothetical protein Tco_0352335 [Tanacetum coccineum]